MVSQRGTNLLGWEAFIASVDASGVTGCRFLGFQHEVAISWVVDPVDVVRFRGNGELTSVGLR